MPDANPRTQQARVTSTLYHVGNPLVAGTASSYDIRDTNSYTYMLSMAKAGVVDMGLALTHNFTRVLGAGLALSASADTVTKTAHGLTNGRAVAFSNLTGGAGLTAGTTYYVVGATADTFQLATTISGVPVNITSDGTADFVVHINCLVQLFYGWDTAEIGGSASATGPQIFLTTPETNDMVTNARYHFLPEVSGGASSALPLQGAWEIPELRAPLVSLKLTMKARETPDAGTFSFRVIRRY